MKSIIKNVSFLLLAFSFFRLSAQTNTLNNIELYGRIWGMVKFYHSTVQKNKINWDSVFVFNYHKFKNAPDTSVYNKLVKNILDTVVPITTLKKPFKHFPEDTTVCNLNFKWIDNSVILNSQNKQSLKNIIKFYKPRKNKTLEKESIGYNMKEVRQTKNTDYPNEANSMLAFFNYWNRINYCFAYKSIMDIPWDETLRDFIPKIISSSGSKEFYLVMAELITRINDGHGWCFNSVVSKELGSSLYLSIKYVENRTVISEINDSLSNFLGIKRGDEILEANGKAISERRAELDKYIGGSNKLSIEIFKNYVILSIKDSGSFTLKIKDTLGSVKNISFNRDSTFNNKLYAFLAQKPKAKACQFISDSYGYIDAGITTKKSVRKAFNNFRNTKAIIIDLRKYGGAPTYFFSKYITNKRTPYATLYYRNIKFPGTFIKLEQKTISLFSFFQKKYKGKIIVLTDEHTGSGMEFKAMWLRATGRVTIIGRNTGGYDGGCVSFLICPDFGGAYSGDAVFYPDGRQTQRIGIVPDIYVNDTYNGVKRGKDEILERAIHFLTNGK